jgi:hypothetical protein
MPPRHAYWTIIYGNQPTSFRAATRDELLPTLRQLQSKHPDAVMMWFARGRLWGSPDEAREALEQRRARPQRHDHRQWPDRRPPMRSGDRTDERRGKDWRPGGAHRDPRDRFKVPRDVKRKRFAARVRRDAGVRRSPQERSDKKPDKKKDGDE